MANGVTPDDIALKGVRYARGRLGDWLAEIGRVDGDDAGGHAGRPAAPAGGPAGRAADERHRRGLALAGHRGEPVHGRGGGGAGGLPVHLGGAAQVPERRHPALGGDRAGPGAHGARDRRPRRRLDRGRAGHHEGDRADRRAARDGHQPDALPGGAARAGGDRHAAGAHGLRRRDRHLRRLRGGGDGPRRARARSTCRACASSSG